MAHRVNDRVTIAPSAREPMILQLQYHADITRRTDRGFYVTTGDALVVDGDGRIVHDDNGRARLEEFGPFQADQLLPGWVEP